ncbi:hypothetical protein [Flavobacterium gelatinilyticum]|uniref:hypothetical protein n=1 Tax=Flavobacterium gelatinilyticum TaxID=3003260 RepID=UPI002480CA8F|nr:hypothetical protein [Flavobacterium gelatinilyticum]
MKKVFLLFLLVVLNGCEIENINYSVPIIFSYEPENVQTTSASLGGEIASEGGKKISEFGIVWSKSANPTVNDNKIAEGTGRGETFKTYNIFEPATTYYYRFYAVNEIGAGYGKEYSFTTGEKAPCNPTTDNQISLSRSLPTISINDVEISNPGWGFNEGNIEFKTSASYSTVRIIVQFNEYNQNPPLTGTYTVVSGDFGNNKNLSTGEAKLSIENYGGYPGGAVAATGTKFYVKNENNVVSIIFCDTPVGENYMLNGKFSHSFK